jgi:hypothetical protein
MVLEIYSSVIPFKHFNDYIINIYFYFYSVKMGIHYVQHAKPGCTTGALHADKSLVISDAWRWKK